MYKQTGRLTDKKINRQTIIDKHKDRSADKQTDNDTERKGQRLNI